MFITQEERMVTDLTDPAAVPGCTSVVSNLPGRKLRPCFDSVAGVNNWFVAPQSLPEFSTAQHEISHTFMDASTRGNGTTIPALPITDWPWLWEGVALAYESGTLNAGTFSVDTLVPKVLADFKKGDTDKTLVPLASLPTLTPGPTGTFTQSAYAQSGLLFVYAEKTRPGTIKELVTALSTGTVTTSAGALDFIATKLGTTVPALETSYLAFGRSL
jgi:hypothetical protein